MYPAIGAKLCGGGPCHRIGSVNASVGVVGASTGIHSWHRPMGEPVRLRFPSLPAPTHVRSMFPLLSARGPHQAE
eukprot:1933206-Amphidinium_carterae.1